MKKLLFLASIVFCSTGYANINLDSLWGVWQSKSIEDTSRFNALDELIKEVYLNENPDTAITLSQLLIKETKLKKHISYHITAYNNLAQAYYFKGDIKEHNNTIDAFIEKVNQLKDGANKAEAYFLIANRYFKVGEYAKASHFYFEDLKLYNQLKEYRHISSINEKIGQLYYYQKEFDKAMEYYNRSLSICDSIGYKKGYATTCNSIGRLLKKQKQFDEALTYFEKSRSIFIELGEEFNTIVPLGNISLIYKNKKDFDKAIDITNEIIRIAENNKDKNTLISALGNKSGIYYRLKQYKKSFPLALRAYNLATEINSAKKLKSSSHMLSLNYEVKGNYLKSLELYKEHILIKEQLENDENKKGLIRKEYQFEYDKKMLADSIKDAEAKKVLDAKIATQKAELKQEKTQKIALYGGLVLLALFGGFVYNRFRITSKQKTIIEIQKADVELAHEELEEKNQEIMDSINYAKRIQTAILPPDKLVKEFLTDSFVLYQPKDIVAGDFYWMEIVKNKILFAAADCTGHGVPGAMVSVVCNNGLNRSVREFGLTEPGKILDQTRNIVIQEFEKSEEEVKDGMDIALCSLEGNKLQYAGAHNPLWIIRKGAVDLEEIKADKQPIGQFDNPKPHTTHTIELNKGDTFYVFSDGFADQFGGEKGKKFKTANFKKLLLSIQQESIEKQRELIYESFGKWKGDLEQLDDVCIIGVRI